MKYSDVVDYSKLDPFKRAAMEKFVPTADKIPGIRLIKETVGESAVAFDIGSEMIAFNVEGLGTKNLIAEEMSSVSGDYKYFECVGIDTFAMSVNDLLSIGARPFAYGDIVSSGDSAWFDNDARSRALLEGFRKAASEVDVCIPCGETPTLAGVVNPSTVDLAGASIGLIKPKSRLVYGQNLVAGDLIYGLASNGVHSNGISLVRKIADKLPSRYFTKMPNGKIFGDEVMKPTKLYVNAIHEMFSSDVSIKYLVNVTGHGWEKIKRCRFPFTYRINFVPPKPELFKFMQEIALLSEKEAYYTWNMGIGYCVMAPASDERKIRDICFKNGIEMFVLGKVEDGERKVIVEPLGFEF